MIIALTQIFVVYYYKRENDIFKALIKTIVLWTSYLYFITELLSAFSILNKNMLLVTWGGIDIILLCILIKEKVWITFRVREIKKCSFSWKYGAAFFMCMVALLFAVLTIPYNWDSMTYHLSRVAYWREHQSVSHYATNIVRQITSPVLAEFIQTHIYILMDGSDRLLQLVQCISYVVNGILIYGLAKKIGCEKSMCLLSMLLFLTLPISFAEALTTQVDQFATLWLLAFCYFLIDYTRETDKLFFKKEIIADVIYMSAMIAFGYLTKPSIMFAEVFLTVWLLICCIKRKDRILEIIKLLVCSVITIILLLFPEVLRNFFTFQALSDPIAGTRQLVGTTNPLYLFVNFLKNYLWNFANLYFQNFASKATDFMYWFSGVLQVDINAASISEDGRRFAMNTSRHFSHDTALNPVISFMQVFCIITIIKWKRYCKKNKISYGYVSVSILSFLCFCTVLRWEPYISRYMLSYFALMCPAIGIQLQNARENMKGKKSKYYYGILGILFFVLMAETTCMIEYHINFVLRNNEVSERIEGYFYHQKEAYNSYSKIREIVREMEYDNVGIISKEDSYDYPMFKMIEAYTDKIEHVNVKNATEIYEDVNWIPECLVVLEPDDIEEVECHGVRYNYVIYKDKYCAVLSF